MADIICRDCMEIHYKTKGYCPTCKKKGFDFKKGDSYLKKEAEKIKKLRKKIGLDKIVGGLEAIIVNVEPRNQKKAVAELIKYTSHSFHEAFENDEYRTAVLKVKNSADILIRSRKKKTNPFKSTGPSSKFMPNTRLETYIFETSDIEKYVKIQKKQGIKFMKSIEETENYKFIQTRPSKLTSNSIGVIEWKNKTLKEKKKSLKEKFRKNELRNFKNGKKINWKFNERNMKNVTYIDHCATRVHSYERDAAVLEFMELTNYNFEFAIYVKALNSITSVTKLTGKDFALVFTSGIPTKKNENEGPTERFIRLYGKRTHHLAFITKDIDNTFKKLKRKGMKFLLPLVGSPKEGLKQTFSEPSKNTLLVNEYIYRYKDFDGYFTKSNVESLTEATYRQC